MATSLSNFDVADHYTVPNVTATAGAGYLPQTWAKLPSDLDAANQHIAQTLATAAGTGDLVTVSEILSRWSVRPGSEPAYPRL